MNTPAPPYPRTPAPKSALIVFAKAPVPGQVKTRLTEVLSEEEAARLYEAFLHDTLAQYTTLAQKRSAALRLYHADARWPGRLTPDGLSLHRQRGEGLGERMAAAFRESFAGGADRALIVGTDHPTLPPAFIEKGMDALGQDAEALCIGPSTDGGFYLLGMRGFVPQLFREMTYSHARVFLETLHRAAGVDKTPVVLPEWYDVDTPADLRRLAADLAAGHARRAPQTRCCVKRVLEKYPALRPQPAPSARR